MESYDDFAEAVIRTLRGLSPDLLEAGASGAVTATSDVQSTGSLSILLGQAKHLCHLVPHLVENLERLTYGREEHYPTRNPRNAVLPTMARSYQLAQGRLLPREWLRPEPIAEVDLGPLGFLLHLIHQSQASISQANARIGKYLEDALPAREVDSRFAHEEAAALRRLHANIHAASADLARASLLVLAKTGYKLVATPRFPSPFPRSPIWARLRRIASEILNPKGVLAAKFNSLLSAPVSIADLPFLYQRWCGAMLLTTLEDMGWTVTRDRVPALFLGGCIPLRKDSTTISLWIEPRLTTRGSHPSELHCGMSHEATPDLLLVTSGPGGMDAFILDPTMSSNQDVHALKSKYLSTLAFDTFPKIAGQPVSHGPLRSWAMAPITLPRCRLGSSNGRTGTIPMQPTHFDQAPLRAWLADLEAHALAWDRYHQALN